MITQLDSLINQVFGDALLFGIPMLICLFWVKKQTHPGLIGGGIASIIGLAYMCPLALLLSVIVYLSATSK